MMNKTELRKKHKNIRNNISEHDSIAKSDIIADLLLNLDAIKAAKTIFVYFSYGREVSTEKMINELLGSNKTILIPKCNIETETMIPVLYNIDSQLTDNFYGIKETTEQIEYKGEIDVAIVPGIAFDKYGNRIGHGKGYYDKFFQNYNLCKIGLCYSENLSDTELPHNAEDIAMNYIITDGGVLKLNL